MTTAAPISPAIPPATGRRSSRSLLVSTLYFLLALTLTLLTLRRSLHDGRLSAAPDWDDVLYLTYAAKRINELYSTGLLPFLSAWTEYPPHSPYSCLLAFFSFLFLGLHDWAPYAATSLTLFLFLLFCDRLLKPLPLPARLLAILYVLLIPINTLLIAQFKPDIPWGMAVATAACLSLLKPIFTADRKHLLLTSLAWSAALLAKPTTAPGTLLLAGFCFSLAILQHRLLAQSLPTRGQLHRTFATIAFPAALICSPYFSTHWDYLTYYIRRTLAGEYASTWIIPGGWRTHATYYLTGQAARTNLAHHLYLLPSLCLLGLTLSLKRHDRPTLLRAASLLLFTLACYLLPTLNPVKNPLLASPLYCSAILSTLYLLRIAAFRFQSLSIAFLILLVAISLLLYRNPVKSYAHDTTSIPLHHSVLDSLKPHLKPYPQLLTVTATGPVRDVTLDWYATVARLPLTFKRPGSDKLPDYQLAFDESDFILAQHDQTPGSLQNLPNERVQSKVLAAIQNRPDYTLLTTLPTTDPNKPLYLFRRTNYTQGVFSNTRPLAGLSPLNAPKPPLTSPYVRTNKDTARILLPHSAIRNPQSAILTLTCLPGIAVQSLNILTPTGTLLHTHTFSSPPTLETITLPLPNPPTELLLQPTQSAKSSRPRDRAITYTRIALTPPASTEPAKP